MSPRRTPRPQVPAERRARRIAAAVGVAVVIGTAAVIAVIRPHDVQSTPPSTSLPPVTTPGVGPSGLTGNPITLPSGVTANLGTAPTSTSSAPTP